MEDEDIDGIVADGETSADSGGTGGRLTNAGRDISAEHKPEGIVSGGIRRSAQYW